ncbi:MAG: YraN family protein [Fimbriimonas sp.]|nr:YraN family protein [Fimbriimonas sp.]
MEREGRNLVQVGRDAEDRAATYLVEQGYTIVTRRYKVNRGEIDLIALDGETLVFVEVKHRRAPGYTPEESIGAAKIQAIQRAIRQYVAEMEIGEREVRLDLIAIDGEGLRHHRDILAP